MSKPKKLEGEKNAFGGANPHGLYVPLTETEQEVLSRLVEGDDLEVVLHGWGILHSPRIMFGDFRISIYLQVTFDAPAVPMPTYFLDLELRTRAGLTLFKQRQPTVYNGQPLQVAAGVTVEMVWDIALHHIDPAIVKAIKPGAIGLTSRRLDKETGEATFKGNMRLNSEQKNLLRRMEEGNRKIRAEDVRKAVKVTKDAGHEVKVTDKGIKAPEVR
jgi:hypothetical protein